MEAQNKSEYFTNLSNKKDNLSDTYRKLEKWTNDNYQLNSYSHGLEWRTDHEDWIPQDIKDKAKEVHKFIGAYFSKLYSQMDKLDKERKELVDMEKLDKEDYKHCKLIRVYYSMPNSEPRDLNLTCKFTSSTKRAYNKECSKYMDELNSVLNELKEQGKVTWYSLRCDCIDFYYQIAKYESLQMTVQQAIEFFKNIK